MAQQVEQPERSDISSIIATLEAELKEPKKEYPGLTRETICYTSEEADQLTDKVFSVINYNMEDAPGELSALDPKIINTCWAGIRYTVQYQLPDGGTTELDGIGMAISPLVAVTCHHAVIVCSS